jgi:phosphatidate phosphatase APP1
MGSKKIAIKVYHGFGHTHDIVLYGHVFRRHVPVYDRHTRNPLMNMLRLLRLFLINPVPDVSLQVKWEDQSIPAVSEYDGFFKAEWKAAKETSAGWHPVAVKNLPEASKQEAVGEGRIYIPHKTQFAFISDVDDTIMVSHSATIGRRLKELLFKNPHSRSLFPDVARHYQLLAAAHTAAAEPNPFFYVSSSEWNLYDYLRDVFSFNKLPDGAFLLNQVKRWYQLWKTGKTKHEGKLLRLVRILDVFPNQRFVLFGDNSQSDPAIYETLSEKYAHRLHAIYIRNVHAAHAAATDTILSCIQQRGIHTIQFTHSKEAIEHSLQIGLIEQSQLSG